MYYTSKTATPDLWTKRSKIFRSLKLEVQKSGECLFSPPRKTVVVDSLDGLESETIFIGIIANYWTVNIPTNLRKRRLWCLFVVGQPQQSRESVSFISSTSFSLSSVVLAKQRTVFSSSKLSLLGVVVLLLPCVVFLRLFNKTIVCF